MEPEETIYDNILSSKKKEPNRDKVKAPGGYESPQDPWRKVEPLKEMCKPVCSASSLSSSSSVSSVIHEISVISESFAVSSIRRLSRSATTTKEDYMEASKDRS